MKTLSYLIITALALSSCCTVVNDQHQNVMVRANVSQADIYLDGQRCGTTPRIIEADRTREHVVTVTKDGYKPYKTHLERKPSAWLLGNVVIGGIIGLVVDGCSGKWSTLTPEDVNAVLTPEKAATPVVATKATKKVSKKNRRK